MASPPLQQDLTAKARIRNAALELYAENGEDATSMRRVAGAAGVTVGLVVHHFGTKDRLREAVEEHVVDLFTETIESAPTRTEARDEAVTAMLEAHPAVLGYLRRAILGLGVQHSGLLEQLTDLATDQVASARAAGPNSPDHDASSRVIQLMTRAFGRVLLQPMIDSMWTHLEGPGASTGRKPELVVQVKEPANEPPDIQDHLPDRRGTSSRIW